MTDGMKTSEYFNNKLVSIVSALGVLAAWVSTFADVLSENGAVIITAAAAILAAFSNGTYALSRGMAKSGQPAIEVES